MSRLAVITALQSADLAAAIDDMARHLDRCGLPVTRAGAAVPPPDASAVLVWADQRLPEELVAALLDGAAAGVPLLLGGPTLAANLDRPELADAAGVIAGRTTPRHESRLRPGADAGESGHRLDGDVVVVD